MIRGVVTALLLAGCLPAATRYVDSAVASSGNGQSWATAWKGVSNITGLAAGDVVYFSGGTTSKTYSITGSMPLTGGTSGNPVTYAVGQDAGHNGTVIFNASANAWINNPPNWVTIDGNVNGEIHMEANSAGGAETVVAQGKTGLVIGYVKFGQNDSVNANGVIRNYRIHHSELWCTYDHVMSVNGPGTATSFGQAFEFDHNIVYMQQETSTGIGCDGIQNGNGADIHDNDFVAVSLGCNSCFPSGQHQDGIQTDGAFMRIFNNRFSDIANYPIFFEMFGSSSDPRYLYNNLFRQTDNRHNSGAQQGIAFGNSGGVNNARWSNVYVFNNTSINLGYPGSGANCFTMRSASGTGNGFDAPNVFANNLCYGTSGGNIIAAGITQSTNVTTSTGGSSLFVAYATPTSTPFDLNAHLLAGASSLIGTGTSMATYATTDKDGVARGSSWDIGAYQYAAPPPPPAGGSRSGPRSSAGPKSKK